VSVRLTRDAIAVAVHFFAISRLAAADRGRSSRSGCGAVGIIYALLDACDLVRGRREDCPN